ncbi:hypothetical protein FEM48_Zijuj11G0127800 [Ziziphus jujuba var. spinosa]|uniref:Ribosomal protein S11, mitochondrial n=1 Tax=Ziziphus jujuba var. spinosa TaxID=714518 RepID=A0A978UJ08_ZIZJJ|nr:hypothetical protein FEM48_Zijuj11G0127800 [Ziziphus jujuba var. spinosa]
MCTSSRFTGALRLKFSIIRGAQKSLLDVCKSSEKIPKGKIADNARELSGSSGLSGTPPYALGFQHSIHSTNQKDFENRRNSPSMNFVRSVVEDDGRDMMRSRGRLPRYNVEQNADFVHIKLMRNNTFVTVTDSKGKKKIGASSGMLPEMKGGAKLSRYAAEATAEHVGRMARNLGLKSVVMKVKGFTYFKKKRQAIMSWREGFTNSRGDQNPIVYIEDTTRRPHNGCRLPKKRRI